MLRLLAVAPFEPQIVPPAGFAASGRLSAGRAPL